MDRTRVGLFLQLLGEVCSHCSARTYCSSNIYWLINSFAMQFDLGYISWDLRIRHSQFFFHFCKAEKCAQNLDEVIIIQCRCNSPVLLDSMCLDMSLLDRIFDKFKFLFLYFLLQVYPAVLKRWKKSLAELSAATHNLNSCLDYPDSCYCQLWTSTCK